VVYFCHSPGDSISGPTPVLVAGPSLCRDKEVSMQRVIAYVDGFSPCVGALGKLLLQLHHPSPRLFLEGLVVLLRSGGADAAAGNQDVVVAPDFVQRGCLAKGRGVLVGKTCRAGARRSQSWRCRVTVPGVVMSPFLQCRLAATQPVGSPEFRSASAAPPSTTHRGSLSTPDCPTHRSLEWRPGAGAHHPHSAFQPPHQPPR
jgi:hypothetical protein